MKNVSRSLLVAVAALVALLGVAAGPFRAGAAELAHVRVVHASPDAPNVDVWADGSKVLTDVAFGKFSDYLTVPAGAHNFKVVATGTTSPAVIDVTPTLESGKYYTVIAANKLAAIQPLLLVDDLATPAAGKFHLRVVHASPDAPAVDVAVAGGPVLVSNLAFPKNTEFTPVDAGTYTAEVRPAGTTTAVLTLPDVKFEAGKLYTVIATGLVNGTPALTTIVLADNPAPAGEMMPTAMPSTGVADNAGVWLALGALLLLGAGLLSRRFALR
jgi:LPXTG-motif cell wall-anchored protein